MKPGGHEGTSREEADEEADEDIGDAFAVRTGRLENLEPKRPRNGQRLA